MRGDRYVPGALVLGFSCRKAGMTSAANAVKLVCMITSDVSKEATNALSLVYDDVVVVDVLSAPCVPMRTEKQRDIYGAWICDAFTKWRCLELTQYSKVLFMDADTIVLKDISWLFSLSAPAATFSSPWAKPFLKTGMRNPYGRLRSGDAVDVSAIQKGLDTAFVAIGTTILLEPSAADFGRLTRLLSRGGLYGSQRCNSGFDEQSISELYMRAKVSFRFIHQRFNFVPWKTNWLDPAHDGPPRVVHYFNKEKPWDFAFEAWPDLKPWWALASLLTSEHPALVKWFDAANIDAFRRSPTTCSFCEKRQLQSSHDLFDRGSGQLACPALLDTRT